MARYRIIFELPEGDGGPLQDEMQVDNAASFGDAEVQAKKWLRDSAVILAIAVMWGRE